MEALKTTEYRGWRTAVIDATFEVMLSKSDGLKDDDLNQRVMRPSDKKLSLLSIICYDGVVTIYLALREQNIVKVSHL